MSNRLVPVAVALLCAGGFAALAGCAGDQPTARVVNGDPGRGRERIVHYGCTSCHAVPGVPSVSRGVGPDLDDFAERLYIAGQVPNRPEELVGWLQHPQAVEPGTLMPDLGVTEQDARDMAAYLYGR